MNFKVAIIMGSNSDYPTLKFTEDLFKTFNIPYSVQVVSAHRTPEYMFEFAKNASNNGFSAIIAGAGGAAHLPGMVASLTTVPVIGVPISTKELNGLDSLLSINQMPGGVPVATMAVGQAGAINAALFVIRIISLLNEEVRIQLEEFVESQKEKSLNMELVRKWE